MTSYAKREIVTRRIEYGIEAGCEIGVLYRVMAIAWRDYCTRKGIDPDSMVTDDWARIIPRDEETVIAFTVEAEAKRDRGQL